MKKDILLVVLILICIGLLVVVVSVCDKSNRVSKSLDEERYSRLVAEENVQKKEARLAALEIKLKSANDKIAKIQDLMNQQSNVNSDLQKQYEALTKTKTELETKLRVTLEEKNASIVLQPSGEATKNSVSTTVQ